MNFPHHLIPIIFHYWLIQKEEGKNRNNLSKQYGALRSAYLRRHIGLRANNILFLINETSFASSSKDLKRPTGSKFNAFQLSLVSFRNKWRARPPAKTIWKWCLSLSLSLDRISRRSSNVRERETIARITDVRATVVDGLLHHIRDFEWPDYKLHFVDTRDIILPDKITPTIISEKW